MRALPELIDTDNPGWPLVKEWLAQATVSAEVLPAASSQAEQALVEAQVTTRSPMGAVIYHSGGLLIDDGWLRILGAGHSRLPRSLPSWNVLALTVENQRLPGACLFADDVVGGFFALNGGVFASQPGHVHYFAPDTLNWEDLGINYSQFLIWACGEGLVEFYKALRWQGWREDIALVSGDKALSFYPCLWAEGFPLEQRSRKAVPVEEVWEMQMDMRRQIMKSQD